MTHRKIAALGACVATGVAVVGLLAGTRDEGVGGGPLPAAGIAHAGHARATRSAHPGARASVHAAAVTVAQQARVEQYWTPWRMSTAVAADGTPAADPTGDPNVALAGTSSPVHPTMAMGRVFFTVGSVNHSCSGTLTQSANGSVVTTAGHCVYVEGYVSNFVFAPDYANNVAAGLISARALVTPAPYAESGDLDDDVGFAVLNDVIDGMSLGAEYTGYPIHFDHAAGGDVQVYGYPSAAPFDGESLRRCSGSLVENTLGLADQGLACDMTQGASGGAWISDGAIVSVSSFYYYAEPGVLWAPTSETTRRPRSRRPKPCE